jgi:hypothetical protein
MKFLLVIALLLINVFSFADLKCSNKINLFFPKNKVTNLSNYEDVLKDLVSFSNAFEKNYDFNIKSPLGFDLDMYYGTLRYSNKYRSINIDLPMWKFGDLSGLSNELKLEILAYQACFIITSRFNISRESDLYFNTINLSFFNIFRRNQSLLSSFKKLNQNSNVLVLGSGDFSFILSALSSKNAIINRPLFTGISLVNSQDKFAKAKIEEAINHPRINAIVGKFFEELEDFEITQKFGNPSIAIDNFGISSYTFNPKLVYEKLSRIMPVNSEYWIRGSKQFFIYQGKMYSLAEFLGMLPGFKLIAKNTKKHLFKLVRTDEKLVFPKIRLVRFVYGVPPELHWEVIND